MACQGWRVTAARARHVIVDFWVAKSTGQNIDRVFQNSHTYNLELFIAITSISKNSDILLCLYVGGQVDVYVQSNQGSLPGSAVLSYQNPTVWKQRKTCTDSDLLLQMEFSMDDWLFLAAFVMNWLLFVKVYTKRCQQSMDTKGTCKIKLSKKK